MDGKARLMSEVYCDGLGACLGHCSQGAISIEKRQAEAFDAGVAPGQVALQGSEGVVEACPVSPCGVSSGAPAEGDSEATVFMSAPFPCQLGLVSSAVPWLRGADVVLAADCVAYAYPDFVRLRAIAHC